MLKLIPYTVVSCVVTCLTFPACQPSSGPLSEPTSEPPSAEPADEDEEPPPPDPGFCGGIAGFPCPDGYTCVDNPLDACDPKAGGADCSGVCVVDPCFKEGREYISTDSSTCSRMKFFCPADMQPFGDECGCGCEPVVIPGGEACGSSVCTGNTFCCNASCGICAPKGGACIQIACD